MAHPEIATGPGWELRLGDCLDPATGLASLTDKSVAAVVTSPPYNQLGGLTAKASGLWGDKSGGLGFVTAWQSNGYSDDMPEPEYQAWQNELFALAASKCTDTGSLFYNHQLRWRDGECLHPVQWFRPAGWNLRQDITWDRGGGMMFNARMFCRFDERILWFVRSGGWMWNQAAVGLGTVWRIAKSQNKEHPVAYPDEIPSRCVGATTNPGDLVCDPFAGSGTTGVACLRLGRRFIGWERDPKYHAIAVKRLTQAREQLRMFEGVG